MCAEPSGHVDVLLIAPGPYDRDLAARCDDGRKMSSVFARAILLALGRPPTSWKWACPILFHKKGHPCCVTDYANDDDECSWTEATVSKVRAHSPRHVVLLGDDVGRLEPVLASIENAGFEVHRTVFPRLTLINRLASALLDKKHLLALLDAHLHE